MTRTAMMIIFDHEDYDDHAYHDDHDHRPNDHYDHDVHGNDDDHLNHCDLGDHDDQWSKSIPTDVYKSFQTESRVFKKGVIFDFLIWYNTVTIIVCFSLVAQIKGQT